jgi:hypothetical protein
MVRALGVGCAHPEVVGGGHHGELHVDADLHEGVGELPALGSGDEPVGGTVACGSAHQPGDEPPLQGQGRPGGD